MHFLLSEKTWGKLEMSIRLLQDCRQKYGESEFKGYANSRMYEIGQGIGAALRGLRPYSWDPITWIIYYYWIQLLSDDLASLQYRTKGGQKAPIDCSEQEVIDWKAFGISGSPMGLIYSSLEGMVNLCVPRFRRQEQYATLLSRIDRLCVSECLNGTD